MSHTASGAVKVRGFEAISRRSHPRFWCVLGLLCSGLALCAAEPFIGDNLAVTGTVGVPFAFQFTSSAAASFDSIAAEGLPPGLALEASSGSRGFIQGIPTQPGTGNVVLTVIAAGVTSAANLTITIVPESDLTATGTVGVFFTYVLPGVDQWDVSYPPNGLDSNGYSITGYPTTAGVTIATLTDWTTGLQLPLKIIIAPAPVAPTSDLTATGTVGVFFTYVLPGVDQWDVSYPPNGLDSNGYSITGYPTTAGVTVAKLQDSITGFGLYLTITIAPAPELDATGTVGVAFWYVLPGGDSWSIYNWNLPNGLTSDGYSISGYPTTAGVTIVNLSDAGTQLTLKIIIAPGPDLSATGTVGVFFNYVLPGVDQWNVSGLPDGLTSDGYSITGYPITDGVTIVTLSDSNTGSQLPLKLIIAPAPVTPTPDLTATGTVGVFFAYVLPGMDQWDVSYPPNGLDSDGYSITGYPTTAGVTVATLTDYTTGLQSSLKFIIAPAPELDATGTVGAAFLYVLPGTETWKVVRYYYLPDGLSLDGYSISGVPTTAGVTIVNLSDADTQLTLKISIAPAPVTPIPDLTATGTVGALFTYVLPSVDQWGVYGLPYGLTSDGYTITGYPTTAGVTVATLTDYTTGLQSSLKIIIAPAPELDATGTVGDAFLYVLPGTETWKIVRYYYLPDGLSLDGYSISGVPITAGVTIVNLSDADTQLTLKISIAPAPVPPITDLTATGTVGVFFNYVLPGVDQWNVSGLPDGLTSDGYSISGYPITNGVTIVTLSDSNTGSQVALKLIIAPTPVPPITDLTATGTVGVFLT